MHSRPAAESSVGEDRWIPSACNMCYCMCSIRCHVVNGTLVKIEGDPESPISAGRMCPKGVSGIMTLYDPNRLNKPLKRTNPEKGMDVDPGFVEISWEEALSIVVDKLRAVHEKDPRELILQATTTAAHSIGPGMFTFAAAFGASSFWTAGGGIHCGNSAHMLNGLTHASWSSVPDFKRCNYALYFGCSKGHSAGHVANGNAQLAADARARGMKLVVVDPMCNFASAKATEWVPILPGTDGALCLAMANLLVNEYGYYDAPFLRRHTNAPYLVGADGHYMRDAESGKPLVWDERDGCGKAFDDPSARELALEGSYEINGAPCHPAFQVLKEHLRKYTPEHASEITTVPAATIRRLAKEFGEAACIGSTILIDGVELPYRPVSAIFFRGVQGHRNGMFNCLSVDLLNELVGASDVPGGTLGFNPVCFGHPDSNWPNYTPRACPDGLMITGDWPVPHLPYPFHEVRTPDNLALSDLFPMGMMSPFLVSSDAERWYEKFNAPFRPRALINFGSNPIMSLGNSDTVAERLKHLDFIVSFDLFLNEFTNFADIVLPDTSYLERLDVTPNYTYIFAHPAGEGQWGYGVRQPVVAPTPERRDFVEVIREIAERLGLREELNAVSNFVLQIRRPHLLQPDVSYSWTEVCDRMLKSRFGDERGLEWFTSNGMLTWPKQVKEVYWRPFVPVRVPIYYEMIQTAGEQVRELARRFQAEDWFDFTTYAALPDWNPCRSHELQDSRFNLWSFYYRDVLHTNSFTMENPWLDEASHMNPFTYNIAINTRTAQESGLRDGDVVWVESSAGRKVRGRVTLSEGIHPQTIGIAACAGHWSPHQPIARGKGVFYNDLLEVDYQHMDPTTLSLDLCTRVRVSKA